MSMPGIYELIIIFGVAILFFGGKKLPGLGSALGESIRNFRSGLKEAADDGKKTAVLPEKSGQDTETSENSKKEA